MAHDHPSPSHTLCPSCDCRPFSRNAYWTGKLMLARDFVDEQQYVVDKLRHHNQHMHGTGVACGLRVVPHDTPACQPYFVCVMPGSAIDCCGRDIVVCDRDCVDLRTFPDIKKLFDEPDRTPRTLQVCIKYRECPTEDIPVLYDECGCDDARCAPNRILESYEIVVELLTDEPVAPEPLEDCCELWKKPLEGCPACDQPDCVVLATIVGWIPGMPIVAAPPPPSVLVPVPSAVIDNWTHRHMLPSVQAIKEFLDCLKLCEPGGGGGQGGQGVAGKGIDAVSATFVDCGPAGGAPGSAKLVEGPPRTLVLEIPKGCDGTDGTDGAPGGDGPPGPGLEEGLTQIQALSWTHKVPATKSALANITMTTGAVQLGAVIQFTDQVKVKSIDAAHVFQVLVARDEDFGRLSLRCRCALGGRVIAVDRVASAGGVIRSATESSAPLSDAVAFVLQVRGEQVPPELVLDALRDRELWIALRCDFVIDLHDRAVDGEHVRGELPSGDRPRNGKFGIQGGLFESWFTLSQD